jgi:hypothetical protein
MPEKSRKTYMLFFFQATVCNLFLLSSCETQRPEDAIPTYIHISEIKLQTDTATQGSNASNISDAWVYVDDSYVGTYSLPAKFPVLLKGNHTLKISPGIKINGAGGNRTSYPFYTSLTQNSNFTTDIFVAGTVNYKASANFIWSENFEHANPCCGIVVAKDPLLVFEGNGSGALYVDNNNTFAEFKPISNFVLPKYESPIYLELTYKTNLQFLVSVFKGSGTNTMAYPVGGGNPSPNWKKIYFDLGPALNSNQASTDFKISISLQNDSSGTPHALFLDNIKIVSLK